MTTKFINKTTLVALCTGLCLVYGCSSATWDDAKQADTYEAYQAYINDNPEGEHVQDARTSADSLYWSSIKNDTTSQSFKTYLDKFPSGAFRSEAQQKHNQLSGTATKGRVTGSNIIIRSDHTTGSPSAGVVANEGTVVQILGQYNPGNSNEAILERSVSITKNGNQITLSSGKAIRILSDQNDSVRASFSTPEYGTTEATISKSDIEAIGGEKWYKIHTTDDITGWIYGKFIEEI